MTGDRLSLRTRVVLASVAALAIGLGALSVAINALLRNRLDRDESAVLAARTDAQLGTLDLRGGRLRVRETSLDGVLDRQEWVFSGARPVERAAAPPDVQRAVAELAGVSRPTWREVGGRIGLRADPVYAPGSHHRLGTVVVGLSLAPYRHTERIALLGTLALDLFVLVAGAMIARRAVAAGLRPVADMSRRADDWSEHDLERRFDLGPPRDELSGLAATLDHLLARIAASRRHEQRFSSEMAHELRTPLSGMRGEAELALQPGTREPEMRTALTRVVAITERMAGAIDTLLAVARGEVDPRGGGAGDAVAATNLAAAGIGPAARQRSVVLDVRAGQTLLAGADEDLIAQALHPLLDNGVRHARTRVTVSVEAVGDRIHISVRDDGPGIAPEAVEEIFTPGAGNGGGGAGLGLALARRLARAGGGEVRAEASTEGGRFVLDLPSLGSSVQDESAA
jgi:signal transduction histidine kinase